jgi:hypothetical protein
MGHTKNNAPMSAMATTFSLFMDVAFRATKTGKASDIQPHGPELFQYIGG